MISIPFTQQQPNTLHKTIETKTQIRRVDPKYRQLKLKPVGIENNMNEWTDESRMKDFYIWQTQNLSILGGFCSVCSFSRIYSIRFEHLEMFYFPWCYLGCTKAIYNLHLSVRYLYFWKYNEKQSRNVVVWFSREYK